MFGSYGVSQTDGAAPVLDIELAQGTNERAKAAATLAGTVNIFARVAGYKGQSVGDVVTQAPREVGWIPLVVGAVVRIGAYGALAWASQYAFEVVDHYLARDAKLKELERTDAVARSLVEQHAEREQKAGKELPLDSATKQALNALSDRQSVITRALAGDGTESSGWGWLVAAAAVVGAAWALT
jgi:hypothetical protein